MSISDGDIITTAPQSLTPFRGLADTVNGITGTYPSPDEGYVERAAPPIYRPDLELEDGGRRLLTSVSMDFVPYPEQAQRVLRAEFDAARRARSHTHTLPASFYALEPGDVVQWKSDRHGYDDKLFRVDGTLDLPNCDVIVDVTEVDPSDHTNWVSFVDFVPPDFVPIAIAQPPQFEAVGIEFGAVAVVDGAGVSRFPAIQVKWLPEIEDSIGVEVQVYDFDAGVELASVRFSQVDLGEGLITSGILPLTEYKVRARYIPDGDYDAAWTDYISVNTLGVGVPAPPVLAGVSIVTSAATGGVKAKLDLSHPSPNMVSSFELRLEAPGGVHTVVRIASVDGAELTLDPSLLGSYLITVRAVGFDGDLSDPVEGEFQFLVDHVAPNDVPNFRVRISGDLAQLSWGSAGAEVDHYHVRFLASGLVGGWPQAIDLDADITGRNATVPALPGQYLIKAISAFGYASQTASIVNSGIISLAGLNVVSTIIEQPAFSGVRSEGVKLLDGVLELRSAATLSDWPALSSLGPIGLFNGVEPEGEYRFAAPIDLSEVYTSRLTTRIVGQGYQASNVLSGWPALGSLGPLSGVGPDATSLTLMVRTTPDDPASGLAVWSDWVEFVIGDYVARGFDFKLILRSSAPGVVARVSELQVEIDMPDRVEGGDDINCPSAGVYVSFVPPFKVRPAISVDGQELPTGARSIRTNVTRDGFHQQFVDASDVGVTCSFDWVAKGYGRAQ